MVVILAGASGYGTADAGAALARETGWRFVTASNDSAAEMHRLVAAALDRREPLLVECRALTAAERTVVRRDLRTVRFVVWSAEPEPEPDVLSIGSLRTAGDVVGAVRRELGL